MAVDEIIEFTRKKPFKLEEYFDNFKSEIKLLHLLYHKNIVRIFNYYLYPEHTTGYIIMEYIDGKRIMEQLKSTFKSVI
tara:strand:- start:341 stop:577 length:237 start_codon:yes stop_codon:yes gene_type:complete